MTPLGKMLAIFNFLGALVWAWLTVNSYAARTNWKAESDRYQKQARESADAHDKLRKQIEAERVGLKAEFESLQRDRSSAQRTVENLRRDVATLNQTVSDLQSTAQKDNPELNKNLSRETELNNEVRSLSLELRTSQDLNVKKTKEANDARLAQEVAQLEAAAKSKQVALLESKLQEKEDKLQEAVARARNSGGSETAPTRPVAPEGFRGTVKAVGDTGEFVEITPGGKTGLRSGTRLVVKRFDARDTRFVGYLTVRDEIDPDKAACQFEPPARRPGQKLTADDYPKPGDSVEPTSK